MSKIIYMPLLDEEQVKEIKYHLHILEHRKQHWVASVGLAFTEDLINLNRTILYNNSRGVQTAFFSTKETYNKEFR